MQTSWLNLTTSDYENVVIKLISIYDSLNNPSLQMSLAACIIRLSGHDLMDFRNYSGVVTGGSDGCVNFNDPDNAGLAECLSSTNFLPVY